MAPSPPSSASTTALNLDARQEQQRGLALGQEVLVRLEQYPEDKLEGRLGFEFVRVIKDIANYQIELKQFTESEKSYKKGLSALLKNKEYMNDEIKKLSASIYHELGRVAHSQRKWTLAEQYYQQALYIFSECNDRFGPGSTYGQLGLMAMEQRQWKQSEEYFQKVLVIDFEFNNRLRQAYTYHNLGSVAQEQKKWAEAIQYYQQSLLIKIEYNTRFDQALTYHNLGKIAQEQNKWAEAEQYYQQSLLIKIDYNARFDQALTYNQLGLVAAKQRQWVQARDYLLQALKIFMEYHDSHHTGGTIHNLMKLWHESSDASIPSMVAERVEMEESEIEKLFREALGEGDKGEKATDNEG